MPKISAYPDAGAPQNTDKYVIARSGKNYSSLWSSIKTAVQTLTDTLYVALTGNQTVAGVKTFSSFPVTPSSAPTTNYQVANKKYVDDEIADLSAQTVVFGNYKLAPSISASDLVLELQNADGDDFTAATPLRIKLYDEIATISGALSVTKADGTNWANLGSTELATQEVDLFAYLIDETGASAGVKLGWSRYPAGNVVGDFSSTTTAEKYLAGPANYNATDKVQNIGRFNAILSGGAGYTWSLPGTSIIINRPFFETRWLNWVPTYAGFSADPTNTVSKYHLRMNTCTIVEREITPGTSDDTIFTISLPFTARTVTNMVWQATATVRDNSVDLTTAGRLVVSSAGSTMSAFTNYLSGAWTAANTKIMYQMTPLTYEI